MFAALAEKFLSFPGLGIDKWFHLDKVAFTVFPNADYKREVAWYGIVITVGMILAFVYCALRAKQNGIKTDDVIDVTLFTIIFGVIGARLFYCAFMWDHYAVTNGTFWENVGGTLKNVVSIWNGGLAIPGGIIAGILTILVVCKIKKCNVLLFMDCAAPGVMLAQAIGRWGNFFNVEAYGSETTLPWRMGIADVLGGSITGTPIYVHPTFLYESLWNILGFVIINVFYRKKKFNGQIFLAYVGWYALGRAFIEGLRTDALMAGEIRVTQVLCAVAFVVALVLFIIFTCRPKAVPVTADAPAFASVDETAGEPAEAADEAITDAEPAAAEPAEDDVPEKERNDGETD